MPDLPENPITATVPSAVSCVVSSTRPSSWYWRVVLALSWVAISQRPLSVVPRRAVKQAPESKRGTQNQSIDPFLSIRAAVLRSPMIA